MMLKTFTLLCVISLSLSAKEPFDTTMIAAFLTKENPYIYVSLAQEKRFKERYKATQGVYDTTLFSKYENKNYPQGDASYFDAGVSKAFEVGADVSLAYRKAEGVQEYNNIKTANDGEMLLQAKLPLNVLLTQIDARRLKKSLAKQDIHANDLRFQEALRALYYELMLSYALLLHSHDTYILNNTLLTKRTKRTQFLQKRLSHGAIAPSELLEAQQQELQVQQRVIHASNTYMKNLRNFLKYLNLSTEQFNAMYTLPSIQRSKSVLPDFNTALQTAFEYRADLQAFQVEIDKTNLRKRHNQLQKYPKMDVALSSIYDTNNESGVKVALNMNFPVQRRQFEGTDIALQQNISILHATKERTLIALKTELDNILNDFHTLQTNQLLAQKELTLQRQLLQLEEKKYELGSSTLFILNQREITLLNAEKKLLDYYLQVLRTLEAYYKEVGTHPLNKLVMKTLELNG